MQKFVVVRHFSVSSSWYSVPVYSFSSLDFACQFACLLNDSLSDSDLSYYTVNFS